MRKKGGVNVRVDRIRAVGNLSLIVGLGDAARLALGDSKERLGLPQTGGNYQSADGKYGYSLSGSTLTITLAGEAGSITVNNFKNGQLGITLGAATPLATPTMRDIIGDRAPIDIDPITPGVQIGYDDLGNVLTDPNSPARIAPIGSTTASATTASSAAAEMTRWRGVPVMMC